jgi:hypothetical protein
LHLLLVVKGGEPSGINDSWFFLFGQIGLRPKYISSDVNKQAQVAFASGGTTLTSVAGPRCWIENQNCKIDRHGNPVVFSGFSL